MSGVGFVRARSPFRPLLALAVAPLALVLAGCGNQYRPVVTATNPVGPAGQPNKYAVAISNPNTDPSVTCQTPGAEAGLLTFVDFSGDTIISTPSIQSVPNYIALTSTGTQGFTINNCGTLDSFGASNPAGLITSGVLQTTLRAGTAPVTISPISLTSGDAAGGTASVFVPEPGADPTLPGSIAALDTNGVLIGEIGVAPGPQYVVGANGAPRIYALSTNNGSGVASALENSTSAGLSVSATIGVGIDPVYGLMTADTRRAFVLNQGSQSVSVINVPNNSLDKTTALPTGTINIPTVLDGTGNNLASNPVWADFSPLNSELVVLSAGDGVHSGLVTVISIPLCSIAAQPTNPNCDATNPVDANGFGTILEQVPVGVNPTEVTVLHDGTRAYTANSGNGSTSGSVSVVNLQTSSSVVAKTLTTSADNASNLAAGTIFGLHPTTITSSVSTPAGKVYVTSPDSRYLSIIYTDTDTVTTHVPLQGFGVRVTMTPCLNSSQGQNCGV